MGSGFSDKNQSMDIARVYRNTCYLRARGFELMDREVKTDEESPYLVLRSKEQGPVVFSYGFSIKDDGLYPGKKLSKVPGMCINSEFDWFMLNLEGIVASANNLKHPVSNESPIKPGKSIKIFVQDSAWDEVAQELATRYPPVSLET